MFFRKWYKIEIIVTPKSGSKYSIFRKQKLTKKEVNQLINTTKCGIGDYTKPYKFIKYSVTKL